LAYTYITLAQAKTQLAARLHDSSAIFFTNTGTYPELGLYIKEALRTWQVLTSYWRERATLSTVAGTAFYDLSVSLSTLRGYTLKDQDLIAQMQYHLLEPATPTLWSGTEQFTLLDMTDALQRRRNQFLAETSCVVTRSTQASAAAPIVRNDLPDTTIGTNRVAWITPGGTYYTLWREDEWALTTFYNSWPSAYESPSAYSASAVPPITIQVAPAPTVTGTLELLTVSAPANLNPAAGVLMNIPDDFCWVVKWGALADLLSKDGPAMDPSRAAYCEQRYQSGVDLARQSSILIQGEYNSTPLVIDSLQSLDAQDPAWENTTGVPSILAVEGDNLLVVSPIPNGVYTISLDVVKNAAIPVNDAAQLQLGREELDAILGYAEHLAMFKVAGDEWESTNTMWENMVKVAMAYNERLGASTRYTRPFMNQAHNDRTEVQRKGGQ
jgi:hypothetical protein